MKLLAGLAVLAFALPAVTARESSALGVGFLCGAELRPAPVGARKLVMMKGMGTGGFAVDTRDAQAQAWFDYGMQLFHAFYHDEAREAFAKAAQIDPTCAMCQWGEALSLGSNLNIGAPPSEVAKGLIAADKAAALAKPGDERAKALIAAMQARYQVGDAQHEVEFGRAMEKIAQRYPDDTELANLAAHAIMTPGRGNDQENNRRALVLLEGVLAKHPNDTAAIHYYIHGTEFAGNPGKALPYAERLADLSPNASHLVHMAAHTLIHVGRYEEVALTNARAIKVDTDFETAMGYQGPLGEPQYYLHNFVFGLTGALMSGDGKLALKYADHAPKAFPASTGLENRRYTAIARGMIAYGRYAPDRALAVPEGKDDVILIKIMRHYARGEAYASKKDAANLAVEVQAAKAVAATAEAGGKTMADVVQNILQGRLAMLQGRPKDAAIAYAAAAKIQDTAYARSFDPPTWWYPIHRSVAAANLKAGLYKDALTEANTSLATWPNDALALRVAADAETKLKDRKAAKTFKAMAKAASQGRLDKVPLDVI